MNMKEMLEKRGKILADMAEIEKNGIPADKRADYEALVSECEALGKDLALTQRADQLKNERFEMPVDKKREYSLGNVLRSLSGGAANVDVGFEREVSQELIRSGGQSAGARGMMVPFHALCKRGNEKRANESVTTSAPAIIGTTQGEYTDYLYPQTVFDTLGANVIVGLTGNIEWPVQKNDLRPGAKTEIQSGSNKNVSIPSAIATPHRIADDYPVSIQLLMQSNPSIESLLRMEIENAIRSKVEYYAFNGSGSDGEMLGILNLSNLGSYTNTGGTLTHANTVAAKKGVIGYGGIDTNSAAWALGSTAWAKAAATAYDAGSGRMVWENGQILGNRTAETDNVGAGNALLMLMRSIYLQYWGAGIDIFRNDSISRSAGQIVFNVSAFADITATRPNMIMKNSVTIS